MITAPSVDSIISRLRPRDVGGIIDQAFRLYRKHFLTLLAIVAVVYVPVQLLIQALTLLFLGPVNKLSDTSRTGFVTSEQSSQYLNELFTTLAVFGGAIVVLSLLGGILQHLSQGALTAGVADSQLDKPVSLGNSYREMLPKIGPLLGYMGLQVLIFAGLGMVMFVPFLGLAFSDGSSGATSALGCLTLCLIFPIAIFAIFIVIRLVVAVPAIMVENLGPMQALQRSWRLVEGYWWRTFGLTSLLSVIGALIAGGPSFIVSVLVQILLPHNLIAAQAISGTVGVLVGTFFIPLQMTAITLYYFDLRVRREGFDIDAAMNQAYPPYGGYGAYGQGQPAPGQYGQAQANTMYPPALGYDQQGAGYNNAPAPTQPASQYEGNPAASYNPTPALQSDWPTPQAPVSQETINLGTPSASESSQPAPGSASAPSSTPYGNDPLGLYPTASEGETPPEPASGDTAPGQWTDAKDADEKGS